MTSRRAIGSVLHNFLGTYTSRYSDHQGYWLFGMLVDRLEALDIDLLHTGEYDDATPTAAAKHLAAAKFVDQLGKAGISLACIREARLSIIKLPGTKQRPVNGRILVGHNVRFSASAVSDLAKTYERAVSIFIASHDPHIEYRSTRGM